MQVVKRISHFAFILLVALHLASCASPLALQAQENATTVYVVSNAWHTSIVVARADLPAGRIPEAADLANFRFLEFGWGDAQYYPAADPTLAMTLRAGLWPTPSVMHMEGFNSAPRNRYLKAEVEAVAFDAKGFEALVDFIHQSFARGEQARGKSSQPGLTPDSHFYPAKGNFHILYTCNTWVARALKDGGLDINVGTAKFAHTLIVQVREAKRNRTGWRLTRSKALKD